MYPQYEEDIYAWAMTNASLLREGKFGEVDINRVAEEIEALGRSTKRELRSRLGILIAHLMKWEYQQDLRSKSWKGTIVRQRIDIQDVLEENPSLQSQIHESISRSYKHALAILEEETLLNLKSLPKDCPYTFSQMIDDDFFPNSLPFNPLVPNAQTIEAIRAARKENLSTANNLTEMFNELNKDD